MGTINETYGDATQPEGEGVRLVVHVVNDIGVFNAGFALALRQRWPHVAKAYFLWHIEGQVGGCLPLGKVLMSKADETTWVAHLVGQKGLRRTGGFPPVRYEAIRQGLAVVRAEAQRRGASVHMPRIGCGLAGGSWSSVRTIVLDELAAHDVPVTVYELPATRVAP